MRCVVPITTDGSTVELHAWYDMGMFPVPAAERSSQAVQQRCRPFNMDDEKFG